MPGLRRAQRGVAMVEFLVVLMPLVLLFTCTLEAVRFAIATIMLQRSAGIAARACAVIKDQPKHCDANIDDADQDPNQDAEIKAAAEAALKPFPPEVFHVDSAECTVGTDPTPNSGIDDATVSARFTCLIPLARDILCSSGETTDSDPAATGPSRALVARARYPHQGASYDCNYASDLVFAIPGVVATDPIATPEFAP